MGFLIVVGVLLVIVFLVRLLGDEESHFLEGQGIKEQDRRDRIRQQELLKKAESQERTQVYRHGRFYCNACGGYVTRHDPSNHPECN